MTRKGYVDQNTQTVFFWSEKSGCTTLFKTLKRNYGQDNKYYQSNSVPWKKALTYVNEQDFKAVGLIRHPVKRVISCYINKFVMMKKQPIRTVNEMEGFSKKLFNKYCTVKDIATEDNIITFNDFLSTVAILHEQRSDPNKNTVDGHWDTQAPPALLTNGFKYDCLIDISQIGTQFYDLCQSLGLEFVNEKTNMTHYRDSEKTGDLLIDVPANTLASKNFDYTDFINDNTLKSIWNIYRIDFEIYGYTLDNYKI